MYEPIQDDMAGNITVFPKEIQSAKYVAKRRESKYYYDKQSAALCSIIQKLRGGRL